MFGIDTFSWYKLIFLKNNHWKKLILEILQNTKIFITQDVKEEFIHFFPDESTLLENIDIIDVSEKDKKKYLEKGFDEADASLLVLTEKDQIRDKIQEDEIIIITEDHPMLNEGVTKEKNIIQLVDFFKLLNKVNFLTKREFYHVVKEFRRMKNITKDKEKELIK